MTPRKTGQKGAQAEEALRSYFDKLGYYVVRSVPLAFRGFSVTDVDLWLYGRPSALTRERINVDVKRKKTPQALERMIWTKGLQEILGTNSCVVATTDNRKQTRLFGKLHGVRVLDGEFLQRILKRFPESPDRLTDEQLNDALDLSCLLDKSKTWQKICLDAKQLLLTSLDFNGCNQLLDRIQLALEEIDNGKSSEQPVVRALYILVAYFLVCLDYSSHALTSFEALHRREELEEGFLYGVAGRQRAEQIIDATVGLLSSTPNPDLFTRDSIEAEIRNQLSGHRAPILAEHFAKSDVKSRLVTDAKSFDVYAYMKVAPHPSQLDASHKAIIGVFADFFALDRKRLV